MKINLFRIPIEIPNNILLCLAILESISIPKLRIDIKHQP
jgi:hypothetical protein